MKISKDIWPQDADGDVLRSLLDDGFDFDNPVDIDFNVDFSTWPPPEQFLETLRAQFPHLQVYEPDSHDGYVRFVVHALLTYDLVMFVQNSVSQMAAPFGGVCESWGVLN